MKKLLVLGLIGCMLLGTAGCGQVAMSSVVAHAEEGEPVATNEETTGEVVDTTVAPVEEEEEEQEDRVIVAKSYQQVYPELYTFYDENPDRTYSKWIYELNKSSGFLGTIFFKDGTSMTASDVAKDEIIDYDRDDNTAGKTDTDGPSGVEGKPSDKLEGDMTVNPGGRDYTLVSTTGDYSTTISTKPIEGAFVDEINSTPYVMSFAVNGDKYRIRTNTVDGTMRALLEEGLYKDLNGSIYVDQDNVVKTAKGTFTSYLYVEVDGTQYTYAVAYAPKYATNTVYLMYADELEDNEGILEMFQMMVIE